MQEAINTIVVKNKVNYVIVTGLTIWLMGCAVILGTICFGFVQDPEKIDGLLITILIALLLTACGILNIVLWQLKGKEIISIENSKLIITKNGTLIKRSRVYELNFIEEFYSINKNFIPKWWYTGNTGGKIGFTYLGDRRSFGISLTPANAEKHIKQLNLMIKK